MADGIASILLTARDMTGAAFRSVQSNLMGLRMQTQSLTGGLSGVGSDFRNMGGNGIAALLGIDSALSIMTTSLAVARSGFAALGNSVNSAMNRQAENLSSVITMTKVLGLSQAEASAYVQDFNQQVAELGINLPTTAENIAAISRTIHDDFAIAMKDAGANTRDIKNSVLTASSQIALLGELSNTSLADTRSAASAYISGSIGPGGLDQYKFFADNTLLRNTLIESLKREAPDADSFGDLSIRQRVKMFVEALDKSISKEDVTSLQGLSKSTFSAFFDKLFDPEKGIFSIQRDLEPNIAGYQTVFSSFEQTMNLILGEDGIFWEIGRTLGLTGDIMKMAKGFVDDINDLLRSLLETIKGIQPGDSAALGNAIGKFLGDLVIFLLQKTLDFVVASAPGYFSFIIAASRSLMGTLGKGIASMIFKFMTSAIIGILDNIFAPVGNLIGGAIRSVVGAVKKVISIFTDIVEIVTGAISSAVGMVISAVRSLVDSVVKPIQSFVGSVGNVGQNVANTATGAVGTVGNFFSSVGSGIGSFFSSLLPKYGGHIPNAAMGGVMGAMTNEARNAPYGANLVVANDQEFILTPQQMKNVMRGAASTGRPSANINFTAGAIVLNLSPGTAEEVAMKAIQIIGERLQGELEARLA